MFALEHKQSSRRGRSLLRRVQGRSTPLLADPLLQRAPVCACGGRCPRCQENTDLKIGAPGDAYEREAEAVADRVVRGTGSQLTTPFAAGVPRASGTRGFEDNAPSVQTQRARSGDSEGLWRSILRTEPDASGAAATRSAATERAEVEPAGSMVKSTLASAGRPLDAETRAYFEPRFGHDLSRVRIHTDDRAAESARALTARAYTVREHVTFDSGEYRPRTTAGRALLAHELTHTIQQQYGGVPIQIARSSYLAPRPPAPTPPGVPPGPRVLSFITLKRNWIRTGRDPIPPGMQLLGTDYGHWWTKIEDEDESYGWWPDHCPVTARETFFGTNGDLNGVKDPECGGKPTQDPHHTDAGAHSFNPVLLGNKTDDAVKTEIRRFATSYSGEWRWTFGFGQNCRTFQTELMSAVGLKEPE
jgi:hypothetical protein